jgi:hypothetical protein
MNRATRDLVVVAVTALAGWVAHFACAALLDDVGLAECLFARDALSAVAALLTLLLLSSRVVLAFLVPGYVAVVALGWFWGRLNRGNGARSIPTER